MEIKTASDSAESAPAGTLSGATIPIDATGGNPPINTVRTNDVGEVPGVGRAVTTLNIEEGDGGNIKSAAG